MSFIAHVRLSSSELMLAHAIRTVPDAVVETIYHAATSPETRYLFYVVRGSALEAFDEALREDPSVDRTTIVDDLEERRLYRVELSRDQFLVVPKLADLGAAFLHASSEAGGWRLEIRMPGRDALAAFKAYCDERDLGFELQKLYRRTGSETGTEHGVSAAQREALVTAYDRGYFEEPREASLGEIGDDLEVSSTAVGGRIRRGTGALVENVLLSDEGS